MDYSNFIKLTAQPIRQTSNPKVREAAENAKVDLAPIGQGLNEDGQVHFIVDAKDIFSPTRKQCSWCDSLEISQQMPC